MRILDEVGLTNQFRLTTHAGGLGGGPGKKVASKRKHFLFRQLVLPQSR